MTTLIRSFMATLIAFTVANPAFSEQRYMDFQWVQEYMIIDGEPYREKISHSYYSVIPGKVIGYIVELANKSDEPVQDVSFDVDFGGKEVFIDGTLEHGEDIISTYSVDGGKTFAPLEDLTITQYGTPRPVTGEDITTIRFFTQNLMGGEIKPIKWRIESRPE